VFHYLPFCFAGFDPFADESASRKPPYSEYALTRWPPTAASAPDYVLNVPRFSNACAAAWTSRSRSKAMPHRFTHEKQAVQRLGSSRRARPLPAKDFWLWLANCGDIQNIVRGAGGQFGGQAG